MFCVCVSGERFGGRGGGFLLTVKFYDRLWAVKGFSLQVLFWKIHWHFVYLWFILLTKEVLFELEIFE